jgi:MFS family permease
MSVLLTIAIVGLWAGAVYEPTAIVFLAKQAGMSQAEAARLTSYGTGLLSIGTILGWLAVPWLAERLGRRLTLAWYFLGIMATIELAFGWAFYLPVGTALPIFMAVLFFLGLCRSNFAIFSLWLPELFGTEARATAFAFCTSFGRFVGARVNFALAGAAAACGHAGHADRHHRAGLRHRAAGDPVRAGDAGSGAAGVGGRIVVGVFSRLARRVVQAEPIPDTVVAQSTRPLDCAPAVVVPGEPCARSTPLRGIGARQSGRVRSGGLA